jgi:hypothetical protein
LTNSSDFISITTQAHTQAPQSELKHNTSDELTLMTNEQHRQAAKADFAAAKARPILETICDTPGYRDSRLAGQIQK